MEWLNGIFKKESAQSLVEVVVAIGLLSIVFTGSWQVMHDSFMSVSQELTAIKAHYLVEEGLEGIRSIRMENWGALEDGTKYFWYDDSNPENRLVKLEDGEEVIDAVFTRRIEISSVRRNRDTGKITEDPTWDFDENTKRVDVIVQWNYKGSVRTDMESVYLTDWGWF